jgi:hypothetical protein
MLFDVTRPMTAGRVILLHLGLTFQETAAAIGGSWILNSGLAVITGIHGVTVAR